jgi:c(7)-type cytochrome triheme protein
VLSAYFLFASKTQAASQQQPIAFNHKVMVGVGIQCLFCHTDARRSPAAGMPSVEKCMGCHRVIAKDTPEIQKLAGYWERQQPIPWVRVNRLPRFVYFSHQVHVVAAGLNCERCHGDVGNMTVVRPVVTMNMGWCLSCHEQQPNAPQLKDCVVCHQ